MVICVTHIYRHMSIDMCLGGCVTQKWNEIFVRSHRNDVWYTWDLLQCVATEMTYGTHEICCSVLQQKWRIVYMRSVAVCCNRNDEWYTWDLLQLYHICHFKSHTYIHIYHEISLYTHRVRLDICHGTYVYRHMSLHMCIYTWEMKWPVISVATHCNKSHVYHRSFLCDLMNITCHFRVTYLWGGHD